MSGRHEIEFIVAMDADDMLSIQYFANFSGITSYIKPRPIGVGDCWNRAAMDHPADFYLALPDDAWIVTPGWDAMMVQGLTQGTQDNMLAAKLGIMAWHDPEQPTIASIFGMTAGWVEANGFIFDPRYPFWFGDSALVEVAIFATGEGMPGTSSLRFASMPGNVNPRLRDMELWWRFFAATRRERIETGRRIARAAGLPEVNDYVMESLVAACEEKDEVGIRNAPIVLASIANPREPDAQYMAAKAAAEDYLRYAGVPVVIPATGSTQGIPPP